MTWLKVANGYEPVGIIELRAAKPGKLTLVDSGTKAEELKALWKTLGDPQGITEKMHARPKSGRGRGPLVSRVFRPGDRDYLAVLEVKLEDKRFNVDKVRALEQPSPTSSIVTLDISRSGKRIGTLSFDGPKPTLKGVSKSADGMHLESDWRTIQRKPSLKVWFQRNNAKGEPQLVSRRAKPGDPTYGNVVRIWLFSERQYDARRAYAIKITTK